MFLLLAWVSGAPEGLGGACLWEQLAGTRRVINHSLVVSVTTGGAAPWAPDGLEQRSREEQG